MLMIITILSKGLGFVREMIFGYFYGTSPVKSAYTTAGTLPTVIFGFVATAIATGYIPIYGRIKLREGQEKADRFTGNLSGIVLILSAVAVGVGVIFAEPLITRFFAPGYDEETARMAANLARIMMLSVLVTGLSGIYRGHLNFYGDFFTPATTGFIMNVVFIAFLILIPKDRSGVLYLAWATVISNVLQYVFFPRALGRIGFHRQKLLDFKDPALRELIALSVPVVLSVAVQDVSVIVDQNIASTLLLEGPGALDYANKILGIISGVIIVSISTGIYPTLTKRAASGQMDQLKAIVTKYITASCLLVIPATVGLMVLAEPVIQLIYMRGEFKEASVILTGGILFYYAPYLVGYAIRDVITQAFFALKNTRTPVAVSGIMVAVDVVLNIILSGIMGINGLALATSLGSGFGALLMILAFRKREGRFDLKRLTVNLLKIIFAALAMGIVTRLVYPWTQTFTTNTRGILLTVLLSALLYGGIILQLRIPEVNILKKSIREKFKGKQKTDGK